MTALSQGPGGIDGAPLPSLSTGTAIGGAGLPGPDAAEVPGAATATAAVESLAPTLGLPPTTVGIAPVLAPVSRSELTPRGPTPVVPGGDAPGLSAAPDVLTPRSYGLPGEEDQKRLLAGVVGRPHPALGGPPGSGVSVQIDAPVDGDLNPPIAGE